MKKFICLSILCVSMAGAEPFQSATVATAAELGANIAATTEIADEGTVINAMLEEDLSDGGESLNVTPMPTFDPGQIPRVGPPQLQGPGTAFPLRPGD
jgi:hypothetical protein